MLLAASCATALEISFYECGPVLFTLLAVITRECWYGGIPAGWARWAEPLVAWIARPGAFWPWLLRKVKNIGHARCFYLRWPAHLGRLLRSLRRFSRLPACARPDFQHGIRLWQHAVYGDMLSRAGNDARRLQSRIRFFRRPCWLFWLRLRDTVALAFVHPRQAPSAEAAHMGSPPSAIRPVRTSQWRSMAKLQAGAHCFERDFFRLVNTDRRFYLWRRADATAWR